MKPVSFVIFILAIFLISLQNLYSLDMSITDKELGFSIRGEYNRTFNYSQDHAIFGNIELNNRYIMKTGLSLGKIGDSADIKAFGSGHFNLFAGIPLNFHLAYVYNGLPGFQMHSHSIQPYFSYAGRRAGIALGINMRNTSFFGDNIFESILSFSTHFNFVNNEKILVSIKCANFDDFYIRNFGSLFLNINGVMKLNDHWSLVTALELLQSSIEVGVINFYGMAFTGGLKYRW